MTEGWFLISAHNVEEIRCKLTETLDTSPLSRLTEKHLEGILHALDTGLTATVTVPKDWQEAVPSEPFLCRLRFHRWSCWTTPVPEQANIVGFLGGGFKDVQRRRCLACGLVQERFLKPLQQKGETGARDDASATD